MTAVARGVRDSLVSDLDLSTTPATEAVTLPPTCYTDESFFEFEKTAIFDREWLCVGRVEQLRQSGDFFTITIADEPLIVVRDGDDINVMSSVCRHRSMVITADVPITPERWTGAPKETSGNCGHSFRCPYHFWTYDLRGQLIGAPEMGRTPSFDKGEICLPRLKVEIWHGFIFATWDERADPLAPRLAPLEPLIANWRLEDLVVAEPIVLEDLKWNWKVMHENFVEWYHSSRLHFNYCEFAPSANYEPQEFDPVSDAGIVSPGRTTHPDYAFNASFKALFPPLESLHERDRQTALFALVPPLLAFGFNSDSAFYFIVQPREAGRIDILVGTLFPPSYLELPDFEEREEKALEGVLVFNNADFATNAAVQKGLRSRRANRGRYSWQEEPLVQFNGWLVERYRRALAP
ncbi:MAG: aromatic ring-hydroxylating dioxygenase subunit alpha [Acidimicrobiia bacterium]